MRPLRFLTPALLISVSLAGASACGNKDYAQPIYPSAADLEDEPKPTLDPAALESDAAMTAWDDAVEAWGERGWQQIGRLCRYFEERGQPDLSCPPPPRRPDPG